MDPLVHFKSAPLSEKILAYVLVKFRWLFVFLFLLPLSFFYNIFFYLRNKIVFYLNSAPKKHDQKVTKIQNQVKKWKENDCKTQMCTSRPGWQAMSFRVGRYKSTNYKVDINLIDILNVDIERQVVKVEPQVSMGQLSALLLELGWTIPIVPELDDLTVGGLLMGTGIETSSHKYGLFQHICVSMDLVLSNGDVITCSSLKNPDLFYAAFWSYGTLGFLVAAELMIIPAKKFVKIKYEPCYNQSELVKKFQEATMNHTKNEFTEGIVYTKNSGVIMTASMTNDAEPGKINEIGRFYKPWFYKYVEKFLKTHKTHTEYIPLRDYYHRHSKSIFWEIEDIIPFGNNPIFRYLFGIMIPPKISLLKLTQGETVKKMYELSQMIQDMLVPLRDLSDSIDLFDKETQLYPLWLCPFKLPRNPGMLQPNFKASDPYQDPNGNDYVMYVDIGAYGTPKRSTYSARDTTRRIEQFVRDVGGYQMLYADTYMDLNEFRQMFHHDLYDKMRKKFDCEQAFPIVYNKVSKNARK